MHFYKIFVLVGILPAICCSKDTSPNIAESIPFERQDMVRDQNNSEFKVDGYWASFEGQDSPYPWPVAQSKSWPHKDEFIHQLKKLEESMRGTNAHICYRGLSQSRIDESYVGNCEFTDRKAKIIWPDGFREHYVETYNVMPSREFFAYVMSKR